MVENKLVSDISSIPLLGDFRFGGSNLYLPVVTEVQSLSLVDDMIVFIKPSGKLAVWTNASGWLLSIQGTAEVPIDFGSAPSEFANLVYWANESGISVDPTQVSGVDGWVTNVSGGTSYGQVDTTKQPFVSSGEQNGLDALYFPGVDEFLSSQALATPFEGVDQAFTVIAALRLDSVATRMYWANRRNVSTNPIIEIGTVSPGTMTSFRRDNTNVSVQVDAAGVNFELNQPIIVSFVFSGTTVSIYASGIPVAEDIAQDVDQLDLDRAAIGALWAGAAGSNFWHGFIYELASYDVVLGSGDREAIEQFYSQRWNIPLA